MDTDHRTARSRIFGRVRNARANKQVSEGVRKGFYLFPNLLTSGSLLLGFYAITSSFAGDFTRAAWSVFAATFFDAIDGRVARLTNSSSAFGGQFDSLSDLVSFGVAPGIIIYNFALAHCFRPRIGWTIAFLYVVCGALRLARYNIRPTSHKRFFEGLPIPAAANVLVFTVIFSAQIGLLHETKMISSIPNFFLFHTLFLALLMVSTWPFYGFKDIDLFRRHKFSTLVLFVVLLVIVFQEPEFMLFFIMTCYALSGIVLRWLKKKNEDVVEPPADNEPCPAEGA